MRKVRVGREDIVLDGDLLAVLETLYREVTLKHELRPAFEDMMKEIVALVERMDDDDRKRYLVESLFLNSVTYENERIEAYMRSLDAKKRRPTGRNL